jgi:hypothetical protein
MFNWFCIQDHIKQAQGHQIINHSIRNREFHTVEQKWTLTRRTLTQHQNDFQCARGLSKTLRTISLYLKRIFETLVTKNERLGGKAKLIDLWHHQIEEFETLRWNMPSWTQNYSSTNKRPVEFSWTSGNITSLNY